jgi:hypothetical protein
MKHKATKLIPFIFFLALAWPLAAQESSSVSSVKETKIRELLRATGAGNLAAQVMNQTIASFKKSMPDVSEKFWEGLRAEVKTEELEQKIIPIYAKHFDEVELQGLIEFYSSPLGRKVVSELPAVVQESFVVGQEWGREIAARVLARLKEKGYSVKS